MSPVRVRQFLDATPFQAFTVVTGDGSTVDVISREFAWLKPGNRTLVVAVPLVKGASEEGEFEDHNIDVFLISKIVAPAPRNGAKRRRQR